MSASSSSLISTPLAHTDNQGEGHQKRAPLQLHLQIEIDEAFWRLCCFEVADALSNSGSYRNNISRHQ
ncbi:hypothetical protein TNCV_1208251 [Trichonephila clavipes]|nr:hypothetical protein TNCV_1208251 [Trichonephila clavipes]